MSDKAARTHTHISNRAKARKDIDQKVVFKSVLDNPLRIRWYDSKHACWLVKPAQYLVSHRPSVPDNVQNQFLAIVLNLADGVSEHRNLERLKRKRAKKDAKSEGTNASKRVKLVGSGVSHEGTEGSDADCSAVLSGGAEFHKVPMDNATSMDVAFAPESRAPSILQHLTIGINEVTRKLESQIIASRRTVIISDQSAGLSELPPQPDIKVVFICRADIDPPILIDHLPRLVSTCNSSRRADFVKLVPLPKGAELTLAAAMGLRRVAVIALNVKHYIQSE